MTFQSTSLIRLLAWSADFVKKCQFKRLLKKEPLKIFEKLVWKQTPYCMFFLPKKAAFQKSFMNHFSF